MGTRSQSRCISIICAAALAAATAGCGSKASSASPTGPRRGEGVVPVLVAAAAQKDVPIQVEVIGNVEAYSTITVKAQVSGELTRVWFREGDFVKKGAPLFTIDPRPFQAAVSQAEANLKRGQAALAQSEANLARDTAQAGYARSQASRYGELFKQGIMSREQTEQISSGADALAQTVAADKAAIESARAEIVAAEAALDTARIQLGYTSIRSPIDGRTGNLAAKAGNLVTANTMDLTTINQVQPVYVTFSVPEAHLSAVKRYIGTGAVPVIATLQDDASHPETGKLAFLDNTVDPMTGTIRLKGVFANADRRLWPGQFVRVVLRLSTQANAVVVPNQAVQVGQDGPYVYVVTPENKVELRPVATGPRVGQELVVETGLRAGETVVTEGQLRLAPGSRVQVREGRRPGGPGGAPRNRPPV